MMMWIGSRVAMGCFGSRARRHFRVVKAKWMKKEKKQSLRKHAAAGGHIKYTNT